MARSNVFPTETVVTTDHREIKRWARKRHARPAKVLATGEVSFDLPGDHEVTRPIDWTEWFAAFEAWKLAFLYQKRQADGVPTYNLLVPRS